MLISYSAEFSSFALMCDCIRSTSSKIKKVSILAEYLRGLTNDEDLRIVVTFLSGRVFPPGAVEQDVNVGYSILLKVLSDMFELKDETFSKFYMRHGDLGSAVEEIFRNDHTKTTLLLPPEAAPALTLAGVYSAFIQLSRATGRDSTIRKIQILKSLFYSVKISSEAKYLVKIITAEMRIGLVEGLVEESIAESFGKSLQDVRTANLVSGSVGLVAVLARRGSLGEARLELFRPTNFMLADTAHTAWDLYEKFQDMPVLSEFKYDGIRAQIHVADGGVKIFSRNLANVTQYFPEFPFALKSTREKAIIFDGEIVAFDKGKPLSFQLLQRRLRKKEISETDAPLRYFAFDLLYLDVPLIEQPLSKRIELLKKIPLPEIITLSKQVSVSSAEEIAGMFQESRSLGFEGLVVKDPKSVYTPGRRGSNWVKLKKELDTLDVVIVAAEYGHGKRVGVISDYTFAVKAGTELKIVGKAYSGLTDAEIKTMTETLKSITLQDYGYRRIVKPQIVLEVAFDAIQKSNRHDSGFALRFPRIKRIRLDKSLEDIDTLEKVKKVYESQSVKI